MEDAINSMVRFSAAVTLFGAQQVQNAVGAVTDSQAALKQFKESLDSISEAINGQISDTNRRTLDSVTKSVTELTDSLNMRVLDPREVVQTTTKLMRTTSENLADLVKKTAVEETPAPTGTKKTTVEETPVQAGTKKTGVGETPAPAGTKKTGL